ncbi:MAG: hypothetical protein WDN50_02445 [Bradyrhizobium sp.]
MAAFAQLPDRADDGGLIDSDIGRDGQARRPCGSAVPMVEMLADLEATVRRPAKARRRLSPDPARETILRVRLAVLVIGIL